MTPHEREQLHDLALQIVINLRSRLVGIGHLNNSVADSDMAELQECLRDCDQSRTLNDKDDLHDQI